jgi:hypothetical protein
MESNTMLTDGVSTGAPPDPKWTVMVFMGANTVEGFAPLVNAAKDDLAEMNTLASGKSLDLFVQLHDDGVPKRHHNGHEVGPVPEGDRDQSGGRALKAFLQWALRKSAGKADKDRHLMLVLWGHAYQFAFGETQTSNGRIDALDFAELARVLGGLQEELSADYRDPMKFDIIGFDACDLATLEVAYQLHPFANYLLASEMGIPIPGWPYDRVFDRIQNPIGRVMGPAELGSYIVRRFCESYRAERPVSLTLLDLRKAEELVARTEILARRLIEAIDENPEERELILGLFARAQTEENKPFVDVADLCLNLIRNLGDAYLILAAQDLGDVLISPEPVDPGKSIAGDGRPFILEHGRNAVITAKLNGVSLYAPHVAANYNFNAARDAYSKFDFARETLWSSLVHNLAQSIETVVA